MFSKPKTVSGVMAGFYQMVEDLHAVTRDQQGLAEKAEAEMDKLLTKLDEQENLKLEARAEAQSAALLAEKITAQFDL